MFNKKIKNGDIIYLVSQYYDWDILRYRSLPYQWNEYTKKMCKKAHYKYGKDYFIDENLAKTEASKRRTTYI